MGDQIIVWRSPGPHKSLLDTWLRGRGRQCKARHSTAQHSTAKRPWFDSRTKILYRQIFHLSMAWENHRIVGVGMDLKRSSSPTPLLKQVPYSSYHSWASRWVLNISTEGDATISLGNQFQCSITLTIKWFFCMFLWNFQCSSFRPLLLVLSLHTTQKSLASSIIINVASLGQSRGGGSPTSAFWPCCL